MHGNFHVSLLHYTSVRYIEISMYFPALHMLRYMEISMYPAALLMFKVHGNFQVPSCTTHVKGTWKFPCTFLSSHSGSRTYQLLPSREILLGSVHTTLDTFENTALFLRLGLPCTLIRRNLKTQLYFYG